MKKLLCLFLSVITLFGVIGLTACGEPEKTDEQIAMEYLEEIKGATYKPEEVNTNGWEVYFCHNGNSQVLTDDYLTINEDFTCNILAYSNTYVETVGTFKLAFSKMQEKNWGDQKGKVYYFDLLENTTTVSEFYLYERNYKGNNVKVVSINIID